MTIKIGCDHAGFALKEYIKNYLKIKNIQFDDLGTYSYDSVDYPDFSHKVAKEVSNNGANVGILICGSGNGICITANKHKNIRAALCWNEEIAKLARAHNNANILCLPGRFITILQAEKIIDVFLNSEFEGGRHQERINKIENE